MLQWFCFAFWTIIRSDMLIPFRPFFKHLTHTVSILFFTQLTYQAEGLIIYSTIGIQKPASPWGNQRLTHCLRDAEHPQWTGRMFEKCNKDKKIES